MSSQNVNELLTQYGRIRVPANILKKIVPILVKFDQKKGVQVLHLQ